MAPLRFICPATGNQVDTGVDLDEEGFATLDDDTELGCPHCDDTHRISQVQAWLGDVEPDFE
jgi:hypothetical protein